jgi:hypothetical protein
VLIVWLISGIRAFEESVDEAENLQTIRLPFVV